MKKLRIAVVHGGRSGEHEVSLRSARAVIENLNPDLFVPVPILIAKDGQWSPAPILPQPGANPHIDVVFPALHGTFGEDGTLQGLLEMAGLPYVGAGVFASSAAMDKEIFKRLCLQRGLPVVDYILQQGSALDPDAAIARLGLPLFVKPANLGSSVGIAKAHTREELVAALADAARYDSKILIEWSIEGQELECAVLGNDHPEAATPCEILPSKEFYDYEDKYLLDKAEILIPPRLTPEAIEEVKRLAVACYQAVDCTGMGRVDFLVEKSSGRIFINELNTIPGFTSISMFPKMWQHDGLAFPALIERLIRLAQERHAQRQSLRYEL